MAPLSVSRLEQENSVLVIVDVQSKLSPHVLDGETIERRCTALVKAAQALDVPVLLTEHCPQAIGTTVPSLRVLVPETRIISKRHFSAMDEQTLPAALKTIGRGQVLIAGMEAHVCVMQTTLGLLAAGYQCRLAVDATGSRRSEDRLAAIERMRQGGAGVASTEMALFEWLNSADHPAFRALLELVKHL